MDQENLDWMRECANMPAPVGEYTWEQRASVNAPCIIHGMPNNDYHASTGISASGLKRLLRSVRHYLTPEGYKPAYFVGTAVHTAVLEPELYNRTYVVKRDTPPKPDGADFRKKEWKDWLDGPDGLAWRLETQEAETYNAEIAQARHLTVVDAQLDAKCRAIAELAHAHTRLGMILKSGEPELSVFAIDPQYDVPVRCRIDWLTPRGIAVDLKTTVDASSFGGSVLSYGYHIQEAFYRRVYRLATGEDMTGFLFAAVEKDAPHGIKIYQLDAEWMPDAEAKMHIALARYAEWYHSDRTDAPGYPEPIETLPAPKWLTR